jgi:hypothetical protein
MTELHILCLFTAKFYYFTLIIYGFMVSISNTMMIIFNTMAIIYDPRITPKSGVTSMIPKKTARFQAWL